MGIIKHLAKQALGLGGKATMLDVGAAAPDFKVKDHHGNDRTLGEFAGKNLVVWFFPMASTPG